MDTGVLEIIKKEFTGVNFSRVEPQWSEVQISRFLVGTVGIETIGIGFFRIWSDRGSYPEPFTESTVKLYKNLLVIYALAVRVDGRNSDDEEFCKNFSSLLDQF